MHSFDDAAGNYRSVCSRLRWLRVREHGKKENPREDVCISSALSVRSQSNQQMDCRRSPAECCAQSLSCLFQANPEHGTGSCFMSSLDLKT